MKHKVFWIVFAILVIVHQDWWFWDNGHLVFGFLPIGLAYHALISLAAAALWAWAVFGVWPEIFEAAPAPAVSDVETEEKRP